MLAAIQPSNASPPAFFAALYALICASGDTVAQLMNSFPLALRSSPPLPEVKIFAIALSSVTTVMITSAASVMSERVVTARHPSSWANAAAASFRTSYTAVTGYPQSFKRRAMFDPIRPTPTKPIRSVINDFLWINELLFEFRIKWIVPLLFADGGQRSVAGTDDCVVG